MKIHEIIANLGNLFLLVNTILFFKSYRKNSIAFRIFFYYLLLCLIVQGTYSILYNLKIDNLFLSHYYFVGQFILLSAFFLKLNSKKIHKKIISYVLITTLSLLAIYYIKYPEKYFKFNLLEIIITSIPLLIYSFVFFIQVFESKKKKFIYINSGIFTYIICSTLLFSAGNIKSSIKNIIWYFNMSLYIVYQVLIFIEWYKHFRKKPLKIAGSA